MPAPGRRVPHAKRGAILAAAQQLFTQQGLERTSMDRIAEDAGVSKATVYAYFASKEVLFRTTLEAMAHAASNRWDGLLTLPGPVAQRLAAVASVLLQVWTNAARQDAAYGLVRPPSLPSQIREEMWTLCFERCDSTMRALLAREVAQGALVIDNLPDASVQFFGLITAVPTECQRLACHRMQPQRSATSMARWQRSCARIARCQRRPQRPAGERRARRHRARRVTTHIHEHARRALHSARYAG